MLLDPGAGDTELRARVRTVEPAGASSRRFETHTLNELPCG